MKSVAATSPGETPKILILPKTILIDLLANIAHNATP